MLSSPSRRRAVLAVVTEAGERLLEEVMVNRAGPARPLDYGELAGKFEDCAKRTLPPHAVGLLRRAIEDLPVGDAVTLAKLLRADRK